MLEKGKEKKKGDVEKDVRVRGKRKKGKKKRREKSLLTLGQCVGPHFLAFSVENITKCWVPKGLSEIFGHYWVIENEL